MSRKVDQLAVAVTALLLAGYLQRLLPAPLTRNELLGLFNDPLVQIAVLANVVYLVVWPLVARVRAEPSVGPSVPADAQNREPAIVDATREVSRFGVRWPVTYGRDAEDAEPYAVVSRPRCPECEAELSADSKHRMVRGERAIWRCPVCRFSTPRPRRYLGEEADAVERAVEREGREATAAPNAENAAEAVTRQRGNGGG